MKPKEYEFDYYNIIIHSMDAAVLSNEEWQRYLSELA